MAQQDGHGILAVDAFADIDTQHTAQLTYRWSGFCEPYSEENMVGLLEVLDAFQPNAVLVGSGFEAFHDTYASLFSRYRVLGNQPQTISRVKTPLWLKACCDAQGVSSPAVRESKPLTGQWLYKQAGQCGGHHVQDWQRVRYVNEFAYWQAFQPGQAVGILFVAQAQSVTLIGIHALTQHANSYAYAGATRMHEEALYMRANELLHALVPALELIGVNSIDAIWDGQSLHVIEVNPRLSASMRLYMHMPLMQAHMASCQHQLMPELRQQKTHGSHRIAYARQEIDLSQLDFPDWLEDRPSGGTIAPGQPLCSMYAEGDSDSKVRQALQDKKTRLEKLWGTYVCDRIEFNIH